jgi:regulatory protein
LGAAAADWGRAAREARRRKFGASPPADYRERAKQARFLQYRGFSSEQIRAALGPGEDEPDHDDH